MSIELFVGLGYVGLFLLAFLSNSIPYSTIPYLVFVAPLLSRLRGLPLIIAIIALAAGATAGKLVIYAVGRSISSVKTVRNFIRGFSYFARKHEKVTFITVFLIAALPIPDDIFYIPIGASGYNVMQFTIALFTGKLIITLLTAVYGFILSYLLEGVTELPMVVSIPIMIVITAVLMVAFGKVDWAGVEKAYYEKGILPAFAYVVMSFIEVLILRPAIKLKSLICNK
ncbi:MAG: VTT domain-containing protein [Desulfurococcaceae archaeon]